MKTRLADSLPRHLGLALVAALVAAPIALAPARAAAEVPAVKKLAMVDMQRVLNETKAGKKARTELESSSKAKQEKLDKKRGKNNAFMQWPRGFQWMPNIDRENYHWGGTYYAIRNGDMTPAAQDLPKYGHLFHLFTGAYDRGSKALGMIESQLGEAAFLDFTRTVVAKYGWRVLQIADYRRELEEYTGRDWGEFFDRWIFGKGLTDWKLENPARLSATPVGSCSRAYTPRETATAEPTAAGTSRVASRAPSAPPRLLRPPPPVTARLSRGLTGACASASMAPAPIMMK